MLFRTMMICAAIAAAMLFAPAFAASQKDHEDCSKAGGDIAIPSCTRIINDHNESVRNRAIAYYNRGSAWSDKGDNDRAIADYSETIRLDPNYAPAYNNRGNAWGDKGDTDRAIADYSEAIRLDPKFVPAYNNRGSAWGDKGNNDRAIADYSEAIRLDPKGAGSYRSRGHANFDKGDFTAAAADLLRASDLTDDAHAMLWRFLALGRMGQDGIAELSANAARLKAKDWPYAVIDFYLGRQSFDEMSAAAASDGDRCEVQFYFGEWNVLRGDKEEAKLALQKAVEICPKGFIEHAGAVAELKRLNR